MSGSRSCGAMHRLTDRAFFARDAITLSKALLGKLLVYEVDGEQLVLRITETEAYLGVEDKASHSNGGRMSERNRIMFGEPGYVYMFLIYGMYHCFNFTCNTLGKHEAILIRAGEPVRGTEIMLKNRKLDGSTKSEALKLRSIADGPGKLAMALGLNLSHYGLDLADESGASPIYFAEDDFTVNEDEIIADARIGIDYAAQDRDKPWRFYLKDHVVSLTKEKRLKKQKKNV